MELVLQQVNLSTQRSTSHHPRWRSQTRRYHLLASFHHHNCQSPQVHPTKIGGRGQHDQGGEGSLIPSNTGNVWPWAWKLNSEEATPSNCPYASLIQPKELLQPVDTSSQVSIEMAETSLEGVPTSISPIVATSKSESITPPVDAVELHTNANKTLKELLTTKASIDTCRQRAVWELGMELHWNESKAMESIKEAKAICSQANLDAQALCFATVKEAKAVCSCATLEAKAICLETVKEAKTTCTCSIQENKAVCSMAIRDAEAHKASQAKLLQKEHGNIMWDMERQVIQEEVRSQADFLSACQATMCTSPMALKNAMMTSYHILLGQAPPSPPFILLQRTSPVEEQLAPAAPPASMPEWSPWPKRWCPSPDPMESTPLGRTTLRQPQEDPLAPSSKKPCPGTEYISQAMPRHLAGTQIW